MVTDRALDNLKKRLAIEEENMLLIRHPYLTPVRNFVFIFLILDKNAIFWYF